jgi:hypothetical protein
VLVVPIREDMRSVQDDGSMIELGPPPDVSLEV